MLNHVPEIEIPQSDPFVNDKLERKQEVLNFEKMVSLYGDSGCVIAINGDWGSGKTTFVRMLVKDMKNKGYHPLYFNAWKNDNLQDSLIALVSQLQDILPKSSKIDNLIDCGSKIAIDVSKELVNSVIQKFVGANVKGIAEAITDNLSASFKNEIEAYKQQTKSFEAFKDALSEYIKEVTVDITKPVVFFVDELDRCNPHFAMNILERIKHLFDIPNIVFVLSINRSQLENSISGYFGNNLLDSAKYLSRFIDVEYQLPEVDKKKYIDYLWDTYHFDSLGKTYSRHYNSELKRDWDNWRYGMYIIAYSSFDLRTIDRIMANTRLALETYPETHYIYPDIVMLLYYIKYLNRNLYNRIVRRTIEVDDLANEVYKILEQPLSEIKSQHHNTDQYTDIFGKFICMFFLYKNNQYTCKIEDFQKIIATIKMERLEEVFKWYTSAHERFCSLQIILEHIELIKNFEQKDN